MHTNRFKANKCQLIYVTQYNFRFKSFFNQKNQIKIILDELGYSISANWIDLELVLVYWIQNGSET